MKSFFKDLHFTNQLRLLLYIGIALVLVGGSSYAYLHYLIKGEETNLVKAGCLKVNVKELNNINLKDQVPIDDEEGKKLSPYSYTITNSCNLEAYYETTFNTLTSSNSSNDGNVKIYLTGDNYFEPTLLTDFRQVTLIDKPSDVNTSYLIDSGYLKSGESKSFNIRMWIDYDTTSFEGNFKSKVIVSSFAGTGPSFPEKTTGYQIIARSGVISSNNVNPNFSLTAPTVSTQKSGLYKTQGADNSYVYYFRGNPNNYFKFGKYKAAVNFTYKNSANADVTVKHNVNDSMIWRVLKINEDGSIKLILDDFIGVTSFSTTNNAYFDASSVKTYLETFYNSNLTSLDNYIKDSTFCIDKTSSNNIYSSLTKNISSTSPSLKCDSSNIYTSKIGLIEADELAMAGNVYNKQSVDNYLYIDSTGWYTLSPAKIEDNILYNITSNATSSISYNKITDSLGIRPVITIKNGYILDGNGSIDKPYEIVDQIKDTKTLVVDPKGGLYNGNSNAETYKLTEGEIFVLATPTKEGYGFSGWTITSGNATLENNVLTMSNEDITVEATWVLSARTLVINPDGGSYNGATDKTSLSLAIGNTQDLQVPVRNGYLFAGWTITSGTSSTISHDTFTMGNENCEIKANWVNPSIATYQSKGNYTVTLTYKGTYKLEVYGASGGSYKKPEPSKTYKGGYGGYSSGKLTTTTANVLLKVYVGGQGQSNSTSGYSSATEGGYNGGGNGYYTYHGGNFGGVSGGGATDIRVGGTAYCNRIIVAGGGGGAGTRGLDAKGSGGGTSGENAGITTVTGGTQTAGGTTQVASGVSLDSKYIIQAAFGTGASFDKTGATAGFAGGGGGWYGGGSYYTDADDNRTYGGAGGSGYVYTSANSLNCITGFNYLTDALTTTSTHTGDGSVTITAISIDY